MITLMLGAALAAPLTLDALLAAVDERVPMLEEAEAELDAATAKALGVRGAFDPKLSATTAAYTGNNPRQSLDVAMKAETPLGPSVEVGYRRGSGSFPTYDGRKTAEDGEMRLGLSLPLLDGLWLGDSRGSALDADLVVRTKAASLDDKRVAARVKAEAAWWKWVADGEKKRIATDLLALAEQRDAALRVEVREGAASELDLLDNERVLFERRAAVAEADQRLEVSSVRLSLWWRDAQGNPRPPGEASLPLMPQPTLAEVDAAEALERPDVQAQRAQVARSLLAARLARNAFLPRLDSKVELRQDLVDEPTEWVVGAAFELPLWLRKERGGVAESDARVAAAQARLRGLEDQAVAELDAATRARVAAVDQARWRALARERAEQVRALQARSWELGASDLFVLLQREEKLADASKKAVDATAELALADLAVRAAVADP